MSNEKVKKWTLAWVSSTRLLYAMQQQQAVLSAEW